MLPSIRPSFLVCNYLLSLYSNSKALNTIATTRNNDTKCQEGGGSSGGLEAGSGSQWRGIRNKKERISYIPKTETEGEFWRSKKEEKTREEHLQDVGLGEQSSMVSASLMGKREEECASER